jgi:hypothetical protein
VEASPRNVGRRRCAVVIKRPVFYAFTMSLRPALRRALLVVHVSASVGWLGAVLPYLALDLIATFSHDISSVRSAYFAMALVLRWVIVPLGLAATVVGISNGIVSPWGLWRHYWVAIKLVLTLFALSILLLESRTVLAMADLAASGTDPRTLQGSLPHSIGGALVLLVATVLSLYKPKGLTRRGWRQRHGDRPSNSSAAELGDPVAE